MIVSGSYQSPVWPSRSIGLPSRGRQLKAMRRQVPRRERMRLTLAGGDHVVRIILLEGGEADVGYRA